MTTAPVIPACPPWCVSEHDQGGGVHWSGQVVGQEALAPIRIEVQRDDTSDEEAVVFLRVPGAAAVLSIEDARRVARALDRAAMDGLTS